jgi:hypothetical protein
MNLKINKIEYLKKIARETARMSYPGSMGSGINQVVKKGAKKSLEEYFAGQFPISEVWDHSSKIAVQFDEWHTKRVNEIKSIKGSGHGNFLI